jgi:simple sugar transport system permease protein
MRFDGRSMPESLIASFSRFRRSHEFWLLIVILVLCAGLGVANAQFLTVQNLFDLLTSYAFVGILALGLLVVLIAGGIDISFTATASVAQYVALAVANAYGAANWISVCATAIGIGGALGAINAIFIQKLRIPSIIVSVATLNVFYGLLIFFTGGKYIYSLPDWFATGIFWFEFEWGKDTSYGVNLQILALAVCFLVTWLLLNRTNIGRQIYAMGGNADAARRLGFHMFGLNMLVYCYMGVMAGVASLVQAQLAQSVAPTVLVGKELDVVAAVVLGGASLMGGVGTVLGTFLGLALLAILQNGLILLGVSSYWSPFFVGLVILISVSVTAWSQRERRTRRARP